MSLRIPLFVFHVSLSQSRILFPPLSLLHLLLGLVPEYKSFVGFVMVWFPCLGYCVDKYFWSWEKDRLGPRSSQIILLLLQAFHQKREPHSFKIQVLFPASSRWSAGGKVLWAGWHQTSCVQWEGDCLREQHHRLTAWGYFQPCNE